MSRTKSALCGVWTAQGRTRGNVRTRYCGPAALIGQHSEAGFVTQSPAECATNLWGWIFLAPCPDTATLAELSLTMNAACTRTDERSSRLRLLPTAVAGHSRQILRYQEREYCVSIRIELNYCPVTSGRWKPSIEELQVMGQGFDAIACRRPGASHVFATTCNSKVPKTCLQDTNRSCHEATAPIALSSQTHGCGALIHGGSSD